MTRRRAPTFTRAQSMAMMRAQAITPEAQARGDALMRGTVTEAAPVSEDAYRKLRFEPSNRVYITPPAEIKHTAPLDPNNWGDFLTEAAASSPEIAKAARAGKARTSAPGASEAQVLSAVLAFLRRHPGVARVWRQNTGAMEGAGGQFVRFGFEGQPDICGFMKDGRALYVEVKREKGGRVSEAQAAFIEAARAAGCVAGVARSVEDARGILEGRG